MIMFRKVEISRFKGLGNTKIDLTKLNIFIGENGTGKSTVAHALSVIKRSAGSPGINTDLPYINLGSLDKLVTPGEVCMLSIEIEENMHIKTPFENPVRCSLQLEFDLQGLLSQNTELQVGINGRREVIKNKWTRYSGNIPPQLLRISELTINYSPTNSIGLMFQVQGYLSSRQQNLKTNADWVKIVEEEVKIYSDLNTLLTNITNIFREKIRVVPVFRGFLEPTYPLMPSSPSELNIRGAMSQAGAAVAAILVYGGDASKKKIRNWMKEVVNIDIDWRITTGPQVAIINPVTENYFVNEGFGTNQLTFIFAEIANAPPGSLVIIEEPEIHLHPKAQFKFGKLMAKIIKEEDVQIILNTHSEHIVSGILNSIKKKEITTEEASIWFFEKENNLNVTKKSLLQEDGTSDTALRTFIEASVLELKDIIADDGDPQ